MSRSNLEAMARVADAVLEAELAKLKADKTAAQATRSRIAALDEAVRRQNEIIAEEIDAPVAGPISDRWGLWAERARADLNMRLARELAKLEERRQEASKAFGRAEALRLIKEKQQAEARKRARRSR